MTRKKEIVSQPACKKGTVNFEFCFGQLEKLEECARNVVNADTNTHMQFTVQNKYDVFLSSDTFYVEVKMNPRARTDPGKSADGSLQEVRDFV